MKIGYIRISTLDQNTARQEVLMEALGVDEVYIDRMSGKSAEMGEKTSVNANPHHNSAKRPR